MGTPGELGPARSRVRTALDRTRGLSPVTGTTHPSASSSMPPTPSSLFFGPLQCEDRASLACTLIPASLLLPLPWETGLWHALQGARVLQGNSQIAKAAGKHGFGVRLGEGSTP